MNRVDFWSGFLTAVATMVFVVYAAIISDVMRCESLGPNAEVVACAVGRLPHFAGRP